MIGADASASNGVVHVIDEVLMPGRAKAVSLEGLVGGLEVGSH